MSRASALTGRFRSRGRRVRREPARVVDYRTPPGGNPLYVSRSVAAQADAEAAKNRPLTRTEQRQLEDELRAGIERHAVAMPGDERSATEAIAAVPDPDWASMPVPAAQVEAVRAASGPQPALRDFPGGALPSEDVPQSWQRGQHPYAPGPQPSFTAHAAERWPAGSRVTQAYTPDFAEATRRARPYAAPAAAARHLLPALDPTTQMLPPAIGDDLAKRWQPAESEPQAWKARQQTGSINYPKCGLHASFGDYAAFFRQVDEITGTRGTEAGVQATLPAADERWGALTDALEGAEQTLGETTELGAAHRRLREAVTAAPDVETALRLARLAAEAGITGVVRFVPASPEQAGVAA